MSNLYSRRIIDAPVRDDVTIRYQDESIDELRARLRQLIESKVHGLCFSAYLPGQGPEQQSQLSEAQIRERMGIISPYCEWIRTFSCTDGNEISPRVAHEMGLKTMVGAWIGDEPEKNEKELASLIEVAQAGHADLLAVGNEVVLRGDMPVHDLIGQIHRVKEALPDVKVGYVDAYYIFSDHPELADACDALFINCYPFWEKFELDVALSHMSAMVDRVKPVAGDKPIIISETGWPSAGEAVGNAVPSEKNALLYAINAFEWTVSQKIPLLYFSSFDEAWKVGPEGDCGAYWGIWDQQGKPKYWT